MADLLAKHKSIFKNLAKGQRIEATVTAILPEMVILDIGGKSEGLVKEKGYQDAKEYINKLKVGDKVLATVLVPEAKDGTIVLALRDAMNDASWDKLIEAHKKDKSVPVLGKGVGTSGFAIDFEGIEGFIPTSQFGKESIKDQQSLVGKYFRVKVMEIDKLSKKLVMSEKEVSEEGDIKLAKEAMKEVKEGEIYDGIVTTVTLFGAFVKFKVGKAELEGLVHVSEFAYTKVAVPSDFVKEGDKVKVKVLASRDGKLSLSMKQALEDPWTSASKKFKVEDRVKGKVVRISDFGVFVELAPGIEGLIHITKIPPTHKIEMGHEVNCIIEEVNTKDRRIALGLVLTSIPLGYK